MKALTRLLLVNWHYFQNTVIDFGNINFLTGKNSAGKSTIIDALQVVLMGETRSVAFNRAASKKSERTLKSYLIGSMGEDIENGNKSLRDGKDFSTYIVAEFYDDFKSAFFCLGAVFDTFADGSDINRRFFWLKNSIPANSFIENGKTMDSRRMTQFFKEKYPNKFETKDTSEGYRRIVLEKLNIHDENFISMLKKAISFEPINDIEKFITENVCDIEDDIDIVSMQENILYYKQQEDMAKRFEGKLRKLEEICRQYAEIEKLRSRRKIQQFLIDYGTYNSHCLELEQAQADFKKYNDDIAEFEQKKEELEKLKNQLENEHTQLINEKAKYWSDNNGDRLKDEEKRYIQAIEDYDRSISGFVTDIKTSSIRWNVKFSNCIEKIDNERITAEIKTVISYLQRTDKFSEADFELLSPEYFSKIREAYLNAKSSLDTALVGINDLHGSSISMRAFSINIYSDSKFFEREMKPFVITVIKNNEPDLKGIDEISDREVLAQVGIIMMSEIFEFCGNVRINFVGGTVDFSPIKNGACVLDESVSDICSIDIFDTDKIIFIENKTNYTEYCLNRQTDRELVVYHGGFYSPKHGEFFRKLCDGKDIPTYLWSDIDYGGFRMFMRLKKNIVPSLEPLNMNIDSFERYKEKGLKRDDKYIMTLQKLTEDPDYSVFYEVISAIINSKVTVEQECFLEKEKC